jgi:hypothetical protein
MAAGLPESHGFNTQGRETVGELDRDALRVIEFGYRDHHDFNSNSGSVSCVHRARAIRVIDPQIRIAGFSGA